MNIPNSLKLRCDGCIKYLRGRKPTKLGSGIECLDRTLYHNYSLLKGNNIDN